MTIGLLVEDKVGNVTGSCMVSFSKFPLKYKKPKALKYSKQLIHRLQRKKGEYNSVTAMGRLKEFLNSTRVQVQKHFDQLKKEGKFYSRGLRIKFAEVKVKDINIDDDIQRELDHAHVLEIGDPDTFEVPFMSIITGSKDSKGQFHASNGQHTLIYEAALAYHSLWHDYDGDVEELTVPFAYIETDDRSILRYGWYVANGMASKKPQPYDHHRVEVFCWRIDDKTDQKYRNAHLIQKICEDEGFEPISEFDFENLDHPRAIKAVDQMRKYSKTAEKREAWRFMLRTHAQNFPNRQIHQMEITLFCELYKYMTDMDVDVYSNEFQKGFMEPFIAIMQTFFKGGPDNLASESTATFTKWFATEWNLDPSEDDIAVDKFASLVLMLKLYVALGGTHKVPDIVNNFKSDKSGDLLKYLSKAIVQDLKKYVK